MGCPSFVEEAPGNAVKKNPARLADVKAYVRNLALWLAPYPTAEGCQAIDSAAAPLRMTAPLSIIAAAQFLLARLHTGVALRQPTS